MQASITGDEQKRHWMVTIHMRRIEGIDEEYSDQRAEMLFDEYLDNLHEGKITGLTFAKGQMETTDSGKLHLQVYCEFQTSLRAKQVATRLGLKTSNLIPTRATGGHWIDYRRGTKEAACKYVSKTDSRVGLEFSWGTMKLDKVSPEARPKTRALAYLINDGLSPAEIAILDPEAYFTHYAAINALYNMREKNTILIETINRGEEE